MDVDAAEVPVGGNPDDPTLTAAVRRNLDLLHGWAQDRATSAVRQIAFRFHRSPVEIRGEGRVEEIVLAVNELRTDAEGRVEGRDREYVVGWIKRGPTGIIGVNKQDANQTVRRVLSDLAGMRARPADPDDVVAWLQQRQPRMVTTTGWETIDDHESGLGLPAGRPRVKLVSTEDLVDVAVAGRAAT